MEYFIIVKRIAYLRQYIDELKHEFIFEKQSEDLEKFITFLQMKCSFIETQIEREIEFLKIYYNDFTEIDKGIHKRLCKQLNIILNDFENELINLGTGRNSLWAQENGFDFEITLSQNLKKTLIENHLQVVKEFKDFIKVDEIENNKSNSTILQVNEAESKIDKSKTANLKNNTNRIKPKKNLLEYIYHVENKQEFILDLKNNFEKESGVITSIMIYTLRDNNIVKIGTTEFKSFYDELRKAFDENIKSRQELIKYKHTDEHKKLNEQNIGIVKEKLEPLIKKYKTIKV